MQAQTTAELFQLEKMPKCSCDRGFEALYVCLKKESECKDSAMQKYYCAQCSQEDKHDHKPLMIVAELQKIHNVWTGLRTEIKSVYAQSQGVFTEIQPIILYLEDALMTDQKVGNPVKWISTDFNKLKGLNEEITSFYNVNVQTLFSNAKLFELSLHSAQLNQFQNSIKELAYLKNLGEEMIWDHY